MIVDVIHRFLAENGKSFDEAIAYEVGALAQQSFKRQFMTDDESDSKGKLRLSSSGKCARQLAYAYHGFEKNGKEIDGRAKFTFFMGDVVEIAIVQVAKTALKKLGFGSLVAVGRDQLSLKFPVDGNLISGHPDGLFLADKKTYLIECKSMSSYSFKNFEKGIIDDSYLCQANAYMDALGLDQCLFLGYCKDSNVLHEVLVNKDNRTVEFVRDNLKKVLSSTPETLPSPPKELDPNEEGFYPWNCLYCAYWGNCRQTAEKVLVKNKYKLKVKK